MKVAAHITYFANPKRVEYLIETVRGLLEIPGIDIFVHTNARDGLDHIGLPFTCIEHSLVGEHPSMLATKSREEIKTLSHKYDYTIYIEDDIRFGLVNFMYYLRHHEIVKRGNFYISFLRVEQKSTDFSLKLTDLYGSLSFPSVELDGYRYFTCPKSQYCALWILDRDELSKFISDHSSVFWLKSGLHYGNDIRENAAIGPVYSLYKTCLYSDESGLFVHHMPNNYANNPDTIFGTIDAKVVAHNQETLQGAVLC